MNWTLFIAGYGAIIATVVLGWDVVKYIAGRPKLKFSIRNVTDTSILGGVTMARITIVNVGRDPLTLVAAGLELGTRSSHHSWSANLPNPRKELSQGQPFEIPVSLDNIENKHVLWAWGKDGTGKTYRSKRYPYNEPGLFDMVMKPK